MSIQSQIPVSTFSLLNNNKKCQAHATEKNSGQNIIEDTYSQNCEHVTLSVRPENAIIRKDSSHIAFSDINIVYTGDIHGYMTQIPDKTDSYIGGSIKMTEIIESLRKEYKNPIVIDAGDWGQGTLESNLSKGEDMAGIFSRGKYDAVAIGNHEFDWGVKNLKDIIANAQMPVLSSNIVQKDGNLIDGVKPYIIKTVNGLDVGIVGLITEDVPKAAIPSNIEGLKFINMVETAERYVKEMKKQGADFIIAVTHADDKKDEELARKVEGIDVIVGGHSHNLTKEPEKVNNTLIVKAGTKGKQIGHLSLKVINEKIISEEYMFNPHCTVGFNKKADHIISFDNEMINVESNPVENLVFSVMEKTRCKKEELIGSLAFDLTHDASRGGETILGNFITDAIKVMAKTDIAFQTSSGIRDQINKGKLTYGDIYKVFPFDNRTVCIDLSGKQIKNIMEISAGANLDKSYLQVSGISVDIDNRKPMGERVSNIQVNKQPLEEGKTYRVAINDLLVTGSFGYTEFKNGSNVEYMKLQRDVILDYISQNPNIVNVPELGRLNLKNFS
ncbi:MAG: bifunctional UDP-sugar hydrolase/5'-nucleotidase [Vulcanimicrobiota bacterium]